MAFVVRGIFCPLLSFIRPSTHPIMKAHAHTSSFSPIPVDEAVPRMFMSSKMENVLWDLVGNFVVRLFADRCSGVEKYCFREQSYVPYIFQHTLAHYTAL